MRRILLTGLLAILALSPSGALSEAVFDHQVHGEDAELDCGACHSPEAGGLPQVALMPDRAVCLDCHDEDVLVTLPAQPLSHVGNYRHSHQFHLRGGDDDCALCHRESENCTLCHHGENLDFLAHDRNWLYTHALTGLKGIENCASCHETGSFCTDCHAGFGVKPGSHLSANWRAGNGGQHAVDGRADLGHCLLCHDGLSPALCSGCHPGLGD